MIYFIEFLTLESRNTNYSQIINRKYLFNHITRLLLLLIKRKQSRKEESNSSKPFKLSSRYSISVSLILPNSDSQINLDVSFKFGIALSLVAYKLANLHMVITNPHSLLQPSVLYPFTSSCWLLTNSRLHPLNLLASALNQSETFKFSR